MRWSTFARTEVSSVQTSSRRGRPPRSRSLWPMLVSIWDWERRWVPEHIGDLPRIHHTACDEDFAPHVTCRSCKEPVSEKDVVARWGPSGSWARSVPAVANRRRSASRQAGLFPQTMTVLGDRWAFAILVAAFVGMSRFTDFQRQLAAPPGSIADRLSIFHANGVLDAADNRYRLTEKGRALFPVLMTALQWAQRWFDASEGPAVVLTHTACGERFTAVMICGQCTQPLRGAGISAILRQKSTCQQFLAGTLMVRVLISPLHSDLVARQGGGL